MRGTDCERFDAWLDAGRPHPGAAAGEAHAAVCARCGERLAAEHAIETLLVSPVAPRGFTARVMLAVGNASEARARAAALAPGDPLPWWARAALQPAALGAAALAALLAWRPDAFVQAGRAGLAGGVAMWQTVTAELARMLGPATVTLAADPVVQLGLLGALALLLALAATPLYHWTERVAARVASGGPSAAALR